MIGYFKNMFSRNTNTAPTFNFYYNQETNTLFKNVKDDLITDRVIKIDENLYNELYGKPYQCGKYGFPIIPTTNKPHPSYTWDRETESWVTTKENAKQLLEEYQTKCYEQINQLSNQLLAQVDNFNPTLASCWLLWYQAAKLLESKATAYMSHNSDIQVVEAKRVLNNFKTIMKASEEGENLMHKVINDYEQRSEKILQIASDITLKINTVRGFTSWQACSNYFDGLKGQNVVATLTA